MGREQYLKDIESAFFEEDKKIIIISSFSGTGKTTLACEIAHRFTKKSFNNHLAYCVKSDGKNSDYYFENFAKYELHINLNEKNDKEFITRQIKITLEKATENLLFIFDNCDDFQNIKDYLTMILSLEKSKIIITTTRDRIPIEDLNRENTKKIILDPFNENESMKFININFGNGTTDEEIREILKLLETPLDELKRPIDLIKLIAHVKLNLRAFQKLTIKFIKNLNEKRRNENILISDDKIFELMIEKIPESWEVLKRCSFLDPDFIPIDIITDLFGFDINDLEIKVEKLKEISIIRVDNEDEENIGIRIHRTIKFGIENYIDRYQDDKTNLESELIQKIRELMKTIKKNDTKKKKNYFLHFRTIIERLLGSHIQSQNIKALIALEYGDYLTNKNFRIDQAKEYYKKSINLILQNEKCKNKKPYIKSLEIDGKLFRTDEHTTIAISLFKIGLVLDKQGKYEEALEHYNKSLEIDRKVFGNDEHAWIASTLSNIGLVLNEQGKNEEALEHFNKSLEINRKLFGTDEHSTIATTLSNIGSILIKQGKYEEASEHFNKSLEILRKVKNM